MYKGEKMDLKIITSNKSAELTSREELEIFGGRLAGISMLSNSLDEVLAEDVSKTQRRIKQIKLGGLHNVYEHNAITLYLEDVPQILGIIFAGEKYHIVASGVKEGTSENPKADVLYKKWTDIFKTKIKKKYSNVLEMTDVRVLAVAKYFAGYLNSAFASINMVLTTNYKGFNNIISSLSKFISKDNKTPFEEKLIPYLNELVEKLKTLPYYDKELENLSIDKVKIFSSGKDSEEYFGDVYSTTYNASLIELKESLGYRNINYKITVKDGEYYIPKIIDDSASFSELWLSDLKDLEKDYPMATLLEIQEMGELDSFLEKLGDCRKSASALEIADVTEGVFTKYEYALRMKIHPRAEEVIDLRK